MKPIPPYITRIYSPMIVDYFSSLNLKNPEGRVSNLERCCTNPTNYYNRASEACQYLIDNPTHAKLDGEWLSKLIGLVGEKVSVPSFSDGEYAKYLRKWLPLLGNLAKDMASVSSFSDEEYYSRLENAVASLREGGDRQVDLSDEYMY